MDPTAATEAVQAAGQLAKVIDGGMISGVMDEILGLLPIVIPVVIGFVGLRKGIAFVQGILHGA